MDRRGLKFAVPVAAVAVLWILIVPFVNSLLKYDDPIKAGDQLLIAPGVTFTPTPGWNLEAGLRTTDKTRTHAEGAPVELASGTITLKVSAAPFKGSPKDLLKTIEKEAVTGRGEATLTATGEKYPLPVDGAKNGIAEHYTAPANEGIVAAYVLGGTGVTLSVVGPPAQMNDQVDDIAEMLVSFSYDKKQAGAKAGLDP